MPGISLPLFEDLLPKGLNYGANYLVEFEPHSLWFEASLTLCAQALRKGSKADYHTFTHIPRDVRAGLANLGIDANALEEQDAFRIVDSYTVQTGIGQPEKMGGAGRLPVDLLTVDLDEWTKSDIEGAALEVPEVDKRRFHVDDDTSILVQFNGEAKVVSHFRTQTVPYARRKEMAAFHSVLRGAFSDSFYKQFESFCDGIFEFKAEDSTEGLTQWMRVRAMRGAPHDSAWRRLRLLDTGEVAIEAHMPSAEVAKPEARRSLAAIMFTDTVGFTKMSQEDEAGAIELLRTQRELMRKEFLRFNGREVKTTGDGFLVEFSSALEAVRCGMEMQRAIRGVGNRLQARVGIHLGDVVHDGSDLIGDAVNVASRIESLATPGGVCVTAQVKESVFNKVEYSFESLGTPDLKNVLAPVQVYSVYERGMAPPASARPDQAPSKDRVAVLPFSNFGADHTDEYFADGMTEELISAVSRTPGLRVIARTSVMKYKGSDKTAGEIGKDLRVGSILEGSVRKSGNRIRVSVQLVDATTEEPKWAEEYDRELADVLVIQGDIAGKVASALRAQVSPQAGEGQARPVDPEAYTDYLRGRQMWNRRTLESLNKAVEFFERALAVDPGYAKAYTGLADSYAALALLELVPPKEAYPKAREAIAKALVLDPGLAEAQSSLGLVKFQYDWDWQGAEEAFRQAIRLNPSYAPAHHYFADLLKALGRFDEALSEIAKAQELDPLSLAISTGVGHVLYLSRQYDRAIEQYGRAAELDPDFMQTHLWFGRPYLQKGMFPEAISELQTAVRLSGESTLALAMLGHGLASAGRKEEALAILRRLEDRSKEKYVPSYWIAVVYNGFHDREEVLKWMKGAFEERSSWLVWSNVEPRFDWLKSDGEFRSLIEKMRFPGTPANR